LLIVSIPLYRLYAFLTSSNKHIDDYLYFSTFTRVDSLVLGALVALALKSIDLNRHRTYLHGAMIGSLVVIAGCIANNPKSTMRGNPPMFTVGFTALAVFSACLILVAIHSSRYPTVRALLRSTSLSFLGKYSYAIYLFHMPIITLHVLLLGRMRFSGPATWVFFLISCSATTISAALISWHAIEKKALRLKRFFA
jgi:peptidoglycan/LPS O-acetylase OafA/YrhL